jgi:hypothetical protein
VEFFSAIPWTCNKRLKGFDNIELLLFVQECQDYYQAKDGDGWVERSNQSFFFGIFKTVIEVCAFFSTIHVIMWQPILIMGM